MTRLAFLCILCAIVGCYESHGVHDGDAERIKAVVVRTEAAADRAEAAAKSAMAAAARAEEMAARAEAAARH